MQLTNNQAYWCYGIGFGAAYLGLYNKTILMAGWVILGFISLLLFLFD